MTEQQAIPEPGVQAVELPQMNFLQRLVGIFFEPQKTFEDVNRKPSWLWIFLIISAVVVVSTQVPQLRMDHETYMRKALQASPLTKNLSEEQIKTIVSQPPSKVQRYVGMVIAPVAVLVSYLIIAGILLLVFVLRGAAINYKKTLAVSIWGMGPPAIILMCLSMLFMFVKDPETLDLDPGKNVVSNLGLLVSAKEHPVLESLLSSIDLFSFWTIFLLAVGFSVISNRKLTIGKSATTVVFVWAIWVLGKAGFHAIFG